MWAYVDEVRRLERCFRGLQLEHIPRGDDLISVELSKLAAQGGLVPSGVFLERLTKPSVAVSLGSSIHPAPTSRALGAAKTRKLGSGMPGREAISERHVVEVDEDTSPD
jgi:hypothetical protein